MEKKVWFRIADIIFELHMDHDIIITEGFRPFLITDSGDRESIRIDIRTVTELPEMYSEELFRNVSFAVYEIDGNFIRVYFDHVKADRVYAMGKVISDNQEEICCLEDAGEYFTESHNTISHIALEELLLRHGAMMLHAAYIRNGSGGILFSGPSGIGKSTQAELWKKFASASVINGDRTILKQAGSKWRAYGSPYAGSSRYFVNESDEVKLILMLEQGKTCKISSMNEADAFRALFRQTVVNSWNGWYVARVSDLIRQISANIPVYRYSCTADSDSVVYLREWMQKEGIT